MKKRLICMLLTVLMIVSVFAGAALSANAETVSYSTMTYRMASGDYVLRICQKLGLNYYVCKNAIMKLNNITENQWRYLPVGKLLTLPATDADAVVITTGHGSTATTSSVTTPVATVSAASTTTTATSKTTSTAAAATASTSKTNTNPMAKDVCWWYLTPYRLGAGETVTDACNALGVSFSQWKDVIQRVNKIKNWNNISAGTEIWIPSVSMPASGTNCIIIMAHDMAKGETAYGVVTERGLDYNAIKPLLQIVNDKYPDLAKIPAGVKFFYPVSYTIPLQSEVHGKLDTGTATNPKYKLNSGIETGAATVEFYVGNNRVYTAAAGETVKVVINATSGRAVKDVIVKHANGQADLYLKSASFVMPKCDITVDATFMKGHKIEVVSNYLDKALTLVDGVAVNSAAKGAAVLVSSADPTLTVDELYVSYMAYDGLKREKVTNIDDGFVMPDVDVKVEVVLKPLPTFALFVRDAQNGSFTLQVDSSDVTRAARGAQVTINPKPNTGYTVGNVQFFDPNTGAADNTIGMFNNTFTMPARDVGVAVTFIGRGNNILMNPVEGGQFWATAQDANGNWVQTREAQTNAVVRLASQAEAGWQASTTASDYIVTRNTDGLRVPVSVNGSGIVWFRMPAGGVTVTGKFVGVNQNLSYTAFVYLNGQPVAANTFSGVSFYAKGDNAQLRAEFQDGVTGTPIAPAALVGAAVPAQLGEYISLTYDGGAHIVLDHYDILNAGTGAIDASLTNEARLSGCFQMPNNNVRINAYFSSGKVKVAGADLKVVGSGTVGMLGLDDLGNLVSVDGVKVGAPFAFSLSPSEGYFFNTAPADGKARLRVFRKDNGAEILPNAGPIPGTDGEVIYTFANMPDCGVKVEVTFDKVQYWVQLNTVDEFGNPLNAGGFWKVTVNKTDTLVENLVTDINLNYGDIVSFGLTDAGKSKFTFVKSIINNVNSKDMSFKLTGELARAADNLNPAQPLVVTLVLKDNALAAKKNPIKLTATYNDAKRGNAGFVITAASPYNPRAIDPTAFVTEAYAGDTVAVIPKPVTPAQYQVDKVRVNLPGGKFIDATGPVDANGDGKAEEYTFVMPEGGYSNIRVDFVPVSYNLTVVTDPADASKGLFLVSYNDGTSTNDVLLTTSFKQVPYGSTVKITLTDAAKNAKVKIAGIVITPDTDGSATASIKPTTSPATSYSFKMPAEDSTVTVTLIGPDGTGATVPKGDPEPTLIDLPTTVTLTLPGGGTTTAAVQYYDADGNLLDTSAPKALSGSTVTAKVMYTLASGEKYDGPIEIWDKTGAATKYASFEDGGTFEVPSVDPADAPATASGVVAMKQYQITFTTTHAKPEGCEMEVKINGATYTVTNGTTLAGKVEHGTTIDIDAGAASLSNPSTRDINEVQVNGTADPATPSGKKISGVTIAPASVADGGTVTVNVDFKVATFTLNPITNAKGTVEFYDNAACTGTPITSAADGDTVYVKGVPANAWECAKEIEVTIGSGAPETKADCASVMVTDNVDAELKTVEDKTITVQLVCKYADDGSDATDRVDVTGSTTGLKKGDTLTLAGKDGATLAVTCDPATAGSWSDPTLTIDTSSVENGSTVTVNVEVTKQTFSLPATASDTSVALAFHKKADASDAAVTSVLENTNVYFKATISDGSKYVSEIKIGSETFTPDAKGVFGPFKVTANVAASDVTATVKDKLVKVTLNALNQVDGKPADMSKIELYFNDALQNPALNVKDGKQVVIKTKDGVKIASATGTGVSATVINSAETEATCTITTAGVKDGDTITITVIVK
ncbi:MAG: hypothetical protein Q4E45_03470 [Eubacteriales bacterium]|nr:hypothetical protein [Eubacteriales bacterium]